MSRPDWASEELPEDYVWCTACRSDLYLGGMQWPEPGDVGAEPGESVRQWVSCYVEDDDSEDVCGEDILVKRVVAADGHSYAGPPANEWGDDDEGGAP